jgi:hypothetical protein
MKKTKQINKKTYKSFEYWFCANCLQKLDMEKVFALDIHTSDPNSLNKTMNQLGLKIVCNKCGHDKFIKKDFLIPIEDMVKMELEKQLKAFTKESENPTRREL